MDILSVAYHWISQVFIHFHPHQNKLEHISSKIHTLKSRHVLALLSRCVWVFVRTHTHTYLKGYCTKQHKYLPILSLNSQCTKPYNIKIKYKIIKLCTHWFDIVHVKFCPHTRVFLLSSQILGLITLVNPCSCCAERLYDIPTWHAVYI
jgi:hypothetical protein